MLRSAEERAAWVEFMAAALHRESAEDLAARVADQALREMRRRVAAGNPHFGAADEP